MRNSLINDLGYLPEEVDMIEPQIAAVVIERALARPASGMPASWRKTNTAIATRDGAKPRSSRKKNSSKALGIPFGKIFGSISKIFHTVKYSLPVVAGVILFVKSGSLDKLRSIDFMRIIPNLSQLKTDRSESKVDSSVRSKFGISKQPRAQPPAKIPPSPPARSKPIKAAAPPSPPLPSSNNKHINVNALEAVQRRTWLEKIR
jgi:hypothetical protein